MSVLEVRDRDRGCFMRSTALTTASLPDSRFLSWEVEPSLPIYCCSSFTAGWGAFWHVDLGQKGQGLVNG